MKSHRDEIVGVLQLINRKRDAGRARSSSDEVVDREVLTYDERCVELVSALASQAAVAIENSRLYEDIERLFEGFVTAAVTAIESRDPTTSGHSGRVATLTVGLAEVVDRSERRARTRHVQLLPRAAARAALRRAAARLRQGRRARAGAREGEEALSATTSSSSAHRFAYLHPARRPRVRAHARRPPARSAAASGYDAALARPRRELRDAPRASCAATSRRSSRANEPTILPEGSFDELQRSATETYVDFEGDERPLLEEHELQFLMIRKGNLDDTERREIESHVTHTYRFLEQIPWTRELRNIPQIAYGHHEKLNGQGYPRASTAAAIPVQTRMMTIADIYDALTATDRPYKRAVPSRPRARHPARRAKEGMLDATCSRPSSRRGSSSRCTPRDRRAVTDRLAHRRRVRQRPLEPQRTTAPFECSRSRASQVVFGPAGIGRLTTLLPQVMQPWRPDPFPRGSSLWFNSRVCHPRRLSSVVRVDA